MKLDWRAIVRDALIISVVRGAMGFLVTRVGGPESLDALRLLDLLVMTVGFAASGYLARDHWPGHLGLVAAGTWLFSGVDVLRPDSALTLPVWLAGSRFIVATALVGGLACLAITRWTRRRPPGAQS